MVELVVTDVMSKAADNRAFVLLLQERDGLRKIIVALGMIESQSIISSLGNTSQPRPLTHELFTSLVASFGIEPRYVYINKVEDGTFYSKILFERGDEVREIDARTSDAIAIALRAHVPILISEELLNRVCVQDVGNGAISLPLPAVSDKIIHMALDEAVKNENYELAKKLKEELDSRRSDIIDSIKE